MNGQNGANDITLEDLDKLFESDDAQATPPVDDKTADPATQQEPLEKTAAFSKRLSESVSKKVSEEREAIAKTMGFDSYEAMIKSKESKIIADKGYDPTELEPLIEQLLKQRLASDPRLKELESYKQKQAEEFAKKELAEITKLTDGEITTLEQLPQSVKDVWSKNGNLKAAYLQVEGEKLLQKAKAQAVKGGTDHLKSTKSATPGPLTTRPFTAEERATYKYFNPQITDAELDKKTKTVSG